MPALSGLCTLGHFDLDLLRTVQVSACDAKSPGSYLLYGAVIDGSEPFLILPAFTGVGLAADRVHGTGQRLMRFCGERSIGHGPCLEPFYDRFLTLRLLQRHSRSCRHDLKQSPQRMRPLFIINQRCILTEEFVISRAHCSLQCDDGLRTVQMIFLVRTAAQGMEAHGIQFCVDVQSQRIEPLVMAKLHVFSDLLHPDPADSADSAGKVTVDYVTSKSDCLKYPGRLIGLQRGNTHLRCNLHDA